MDPLLPLLAEVNLQILSLKIMTCGTQKSVLQNARKITLASFPPVQEAIIRYSDTRFLLKIIYRQIFVKSNFQKENR